MSQKFFLGGKLHKQGGGYFVENFDLSQLAIIKAGHSRRVVDWGLYRMLGILSIETCWPMFKLCIMIP